MACRSTMSSNPQLSRQQRRARMALAPRTVQCMVARLSHVPMVTLQPASVRWTRDFVLG